MARLRGRRKREFTRKQKQERIAKRQSVMAVSNTIPSVSTKEIDKKTLIRKQFREFKRRRKIIQQEGLRINKLSHTEELLQKLKIDPDKRSLSDDDIRKLLLGNVLENFLSDQMTTKRGRKQVQKEIAKRLVGSNRYTVEYKDAVKIADIFANDAYHILNELGYLSSSQLVDVVKYSKDDVKAETIENAINDVLNMIRADSKSISDSEIYSLIMDLIRG